MKQKNYPLYEVPAFDNFRDLLEKRAAKTPDKAGFKFVEGKEDKEVTFKEHLDNVNAFGSALAKREFINTHIALVGENSYEWILTQMTVLSSTNVLVPIDKELPFGDLLNVINHSDSEMVVCIGSFSKFFAENIDKIPKVKKVVCFRPKEDLPEGFEDGWQLVKEGKELVASGYREYLDMKPEDLELGEIVYTSGTTGDPKGVMLSRHNVSSSFYYGSMVMTVFDVGLSVLPYNHTYEANCHLLTAQNLGSTLCINESLKTVAKNFKKYKPEHVFLVPLFVESFYKKIIKNLETNGQLEKVNTMIKLSNGLRKIGIDLRRVFFKQLLDVFGGNLRMIVCGGAPIRPELAEFFDGIGISLINGYGITECSPLVAVNRIGNNNWKSVGVKLPCVDIRIEDPNENGEGEILVKGDIVMMGYYKNQEATKEVLSDDGWFSTGDYGKIVDDQLYITGRKKNLIVLKNGKNVYPEEIEDYLMAVEGVEEVIVYAEKDENGDEVSLIAELYPSDDFRKEKTIDEMQSYFKKSFAGATRQLPLYKQVSSIIIRDEEFPKTTTRKIKRHEVINRH